jgi:hypothetical protein
MNFTVSSFSSPSSFYEKFDSKHGEIFGLGIEAPARWSIMSTSIYGRSVSIGVITNQGLIPFVTELDNGKFALFHDAKAEIFTATGVLAKSLEFPAIVFDAFIDQSSNELFVIHEFGVCSIDTDYNFRWNWNARDVVTNYRREGEVIIVKLLETKENEIKIDSVSGLVIAKKTGT